MKIVALNLSTLSPLSLIKLKKAVSDDLMGQACVCKMQVVLSLCDQQPLLLTICLMSLTLP